jgi:Spy/CpxP family protein refolding chaperone
MKPKVLIRMLAVLLLAGFAIPAVAQPGFPWWKDEKFVKDLGLSPDQSAKIEHTFRKAFPQLRQGAEDLDQQEAELSRLIANNADEAQVVRQLDKVEEVRASLNKTRTLMLLHMVRVLSPEQRARFNPLHDQWVRDHPRQPRSNAAGNKPEAR